MFERSNKKVSPNQLCGGENPSEKKGPFLAEAGGYHHPQQHSLCESLWLHPASRCFMGNQGPDLEHSISWSHTDTNVTLFAFLTPQKVFEHLPCVGIQPCLKRRLLRKTKCFPVSSLELQNGAQTKHQDVFLLLF